MDRRAGVVRLDVSGGPHPTIADGEVGWVFFAYPDERIRDWLRPGEIRLWDEARSIEKEPGQLVLFLQTGPKGATWEGAGRVVKPEERWKAFGVYVRCAKRLDRSLLALPDRLSTPPSGGVARTGEDIAGVWDNPSLATRVGVPGFRFRTPFLDEGRDIRVTSRDFRRLIALQAQLATLSGM